MHFPLWSICILLLPLYFKKKIGAQFALPKSVKPHETIAIPLWEDQVAPRFGCADMFLVAAVCGYSVSGTATVLVNEQCNWHERLSTLQTHYVDLILCGGFNNQYLPLAESLGLRVLTGVSGSAHEAVEQYAKGTLNTGRNKCLQHRRK